mmetsp:Transcript_4887/g.16944  ORF Transcript_4887/g.16944 Transcript_4887/m.16944 type:complete len:272 (+) Transcript_4887:1395-2210(+)
METDSEWRLFSTRSRSGTIPPSIPGVFSSQPCLMGAAFSSSSASSSSTGAATPVFFPLRNARKSWSAKFMRRWWFGGGAFGSSSASAIGSSLSSTLGAISAEGPSRFAFGFGLARPPSPAVSTAPPTPLGSRASRVASSAFRLSSTVQKTYHKSSDGATDTLALTPFATAASTFSILSRVLETWAEGSRSRTNPSSSWPVASEKCTFCARSAYDSYDLHPRASFHWPTIAFTSFSSAARPKTSASSNGTASSSETDRDPGGEAGLTRAKSV